MKTVTQGNWNTATVTGSGINGARLEIFRVITQDWKHILHPLGNGKLFETSEQAREWALEHGYLQTYHRRPNAFISLRLSPATRRYLRALPASRRWNALAKLIGPRAQDDYFRAVRTADYMRPTRARWNHYMLTSQDSERMVKP